MLNIHATIVMPKLSPFIIVQDMEIRLDSYLVRASFNLIKGFWTLFFSSVRISCSVIPVKSKFCFLHRIIDDPIKWFWWIVTLTFSFSVLFLGWVGWRGLGESTLRRHIQCLFSIIQNYSPLVMATNVLKNPLWFQETL